MCVYGLTYKPKQNEKKRISNEWMNAWKKEEKELVFHIG